MRKFIYFFARKFCSAKKHPKPQGFGCYIFNYKPQLLPDAKLLCAVQEGDGLCTGAGVVGNEGRFGHAGRDLLFDRPHNGVVVNAVLADVGEGIGNVLGDLGRACRAVQEGDYLSAGAAVLGSCLLYTSPSPRDTR